MSKKIQTSAVEMPVVESGMLQGNLSSVNDMFEYVRRRFLNIGLAASSHLSFRKQMERMMVNAGLDGAGDFLCQCHELSPKWRDEPLVEVMRAVSHSIAFQKRLGKLATNRGQMRCEKKGLILVLTYRDRWESSESGTKQWYRHSQEVTISFDFTAVHASTRVCWSASEGGSIGSFAADLAIRAKGLMTHGRSIPLTPAVSGLERIWDGGWVKGEVNLVK